MEKHIEAELARKRIYIAGPYTKPDPCINTNIAIKIANDLWDAGYAPFIPHLSHFWHTVTPKPYPEWLAIDRCWVAACHAVLRFDGFSSGADQEVALANELGIPVCYSIEKLREVI